MGSASIAGRPFDPFLRHPSRGATKRWPLTRTARPRLRTMVAKYRRVAQSGMGRAVFLVRVVAPCDSLSSGLARLSRRGGAIYGLWSWLTALLLALTAFHARWGYFLALAVALAMPFALTAFSRPYLAWSIFVLSLWPVAASWEETLFPSPKTQVHRLERLADAVALRDASLSLRGQPDGGVVAPWWFSPPIVWWSAKPCVAGSSHQSLPGILDTCRVYLAESPDAAREILATRRSPYVISYDPDRVISNSVQILGSPAGVRPLSATLHNSPNALSRDFTTIHSNRFFKVHRARLQDLALPK